jgi:hypothetical protein
MHLKEFDMVCAMHLSFSFSLTEKARYWLHTLRPRTIGTWQEMTREFLKKFFPTHKTNTLRRNIMNFAMKENETFFQCWERFKELLLSCPHHGYETWRVISFFYDRLSSKMRQFVEMMCNGEFMNKAPDKLGIILISWPKMLKAGKPQRGRIRQNLNLVLGEVYITLKQMRI